MFNLSDSSQNYEKSAYYTLNGLSQDSINRDNYLAAMIIMTFCFPEGVGATITFPFEIPFLFCKYFQCETVYDTVMEQKCEQKYDTKCETSYQVCI